MKLEIGTAPDSWGVWFPSDEQQIDWPRYLDEAAAAGYRWTELGPFGYMPTDGPTLEAELRRRGLRVCGQTVMLPLEEPAMRGELERQVLAVGDLLRHLGARYLILIDDMYTDLHSGAHEQPPELDGDAWRRLIDATHYAARLARDQLGLTLAFHPHAETHVGSEAQIKRFLTDTDPDLVRLCFDTGHHAYCGGDAVAFMREHHQRVDYLHVKSIDPDVLDRSRREALPFPKAVARDMMCGLERGAVDFRAFVGVLREVGFEGFVVVEQDMYPAPPDKPLPIAKANRDYLRRLGWG
jgi:inosose dehydratase